MGFDVERITETTALVVVNEKLWLTEDKDEVVADGDERAKFLLATPGDEISVEDAERYGLLEPAKPKAAAKPKAEKESG